MKSLLAVIALAIPFAALAQSPTEYATLKSAGKVTLTGATKQVTAPDPKDASKQVTSTVRDADAVVVARPMFDPATGVQTGTTTTTFSISGLEKDIASLQAQLAAAQAMLADLKAAK